MQGAFGEVRLVQKLDTGHVYAMKVDFVIVVIIIIILILCHHHPHSLSSSSSYRRLTHIDIVLILDTGHVYTIVNVVIVIISFMVIIFIIIQVLKKMEMVDKDQVNEENETTLNVTDEDGLVQ